MITYHLRSQDGQLKAVIPKKNAMGIFTEVDGIWKGNKYYDSRAFHITKAVSWKLIQNNNDQVIISIMLWEGDHLIEVYE